MGLMQEDRERFQSVFESPSDANLRKLRPDAFSLFVYYLYERDGLYNPVFATGASDGSVDIELRSRDGTQPELLGLVRCRRYIRRNVRLRDVVEFASTARKAGAPRRYFFTTSGFTLPAQTAARESDVIVFDTKGIRSWTQDIHRRERIEPMVTELPNMEQLPIPIVCISNNKGGVGKTTITGNLAAALSNEQRGVLVIDADPQGHLSYWLTNERQPDPELSLLGVLTKNYPIHPLVRKTLQPGVWLLPSHPQLDNLPGMADAYALECRLAQALAALPLSDPPIHYIIIDTPPSLSFLTRSAVLASNHLLIPLELDPLSYEGLDRVVKFVADVEAVHSKAPVRILGGVATAVDKRTTLGKLFLEDIPKKVEGAPRLRTSGVTPNQFWCGVIRHRADFPRALYEHKTVVQLPKSADARQDIVELAEEVSRRVNVSQRTQ